MVNFAVRRCKGQIESEQLLSHRNRLGDVCLWRLVPGQWNGYCISCGYWGLPLRQAAIPFTTLVCCGAGSMDRHVYRRRHGLSRLAKHPGPSRRGVFRHGADLFPSGRMASWRSNRVSVAADLLVDLATATDPAT